MLKFLAGLAFGFGLAITLLAALRMAAFGVQEGSEVTEALALVASENLKMADGAVYVGSNGKDLSPSAFSELRKLAPNAFVQPYSTRPNTEDTCDDPLPEGFVRMGACMKDDYILVTYLDAPLWRTARIGVQTAACGGEHLLVRWFGQWRELDRSLVCT